MLSLFPMSAGQDRRLLVPEDSLTRPEEAAIRVPLKVDAPCLCNMCRTILPNNRPQAVCHWLFNGSSR